MREHRRQLDISVEMSGPHDFAVRRARVRRSQSPRPPHPALNVYDDRETPLMRGGTARAYKDDLPDGHSEIFFAGRLAHRANQPAGPGIDRARPALRRAGTSYDPCAASFQSCFKTREF